jgi:hypothetical protein
LQQPLGVRTVCSESDMIDVVEEAVLEAGEPRLQVDLDDVHAVR